jgi:DNA-binding NarL/FixJ family response regulator
MPEVAINDHDIDLVPVLRPDRFDLEVTRIILMYGEDEAQTGYAVRSGALGYVSSSDDVETLIQAVRQVARGNLVIDPQLAAVPPKTCWSGSGISARRSDKCSNSSWPAPRS